MLVIPMQRIEPETLSELIKDWLTRQSQDWDFSDGNPEQAIDLVRQRLADNHLLICWDAESESLNLLSKEEYQRAVQQAGPNNE